MTEASTFGRDQLKAFVERIERLEEEKQSIADDIRDVYGEAKANGFDTKALREIIKLRKQDAAERTERQAILETYMHALGMLADTPLGHAAIEREHPSRTNGIQPLGHAVEKVVENAGRAQPARAAPPASVKSDPLNIPTFLLRGHADCAALTRTPAEGVKAGGRSLLDEPAALPPDILAAG